MSRRQLNMKLRLPPAAASLEMRLPRPLHGVLGSMHPLITPCTFLKLH